MELRIAARRAERDEADSAPQGPGPRMVAGPRTGLRAQQRAAKAALPEEATDDLDADPSPDSVDQPDPDPTADIRVQAMPPAVAVPAELPQAAIDVRAPGDPVQGEILPDDDDDDEDRPGARRRLGPRARKVAARAAKNNDAAHYVVTPAVNMAQLRPRHYGVMALFVLMVLIPTLSYGLYMWTKAAQQYESNVGFGSRTEETPSTFDFLGALGGISQSGSKDMDILSQFIISQELVGRLDSQLDLKAIYSKPQGDPLNRFARGGTIEKLVAYWQRMVIVNYDNATGLMTLRVFAFEPADAQRIAKAILVESTKIINDLSLTAQEDTTRYSKEALAAAEKKLADARVAVLDFQIKNHIVDPTSTIANQNSVIGTLNQELATSQIDLDMLTGAVAADDVRIATLNRKLDVIRNRIVVEQAKVGGATDASAPGFARLTQEFERLKVDQDFAERSYLSALAAYDQAINDAQHKTRYLATYVAPTLAEAPTAPNRPLSALVVALVGFLLWSITVLIYYALRDRR